MSLFDLIKSIIGIKKDAAELEKTKLEIGALKAEEQERESQIQRATLEDVKKYDPKVKKLEQESWGGGGSADMCAIPFTLGVAALLILFLVRSC